MDIYVRESADCRARRPVFCKIEEDMVSRRGKKGKDDEGVYIYIQV